MDNSLNCSFEDKESRIAKIKRGCCYAEGGASILAGVRGLILGFFAAILLLFASLYPTESLAGTYSCPSGGTLSGSNCVIDSSYSASASVQQCPVYNRCTKVSQTGNMCYWNSTWYHSNPACGTVYSSDNWSNTDCSPCVQGSDTVASITTYSCPSGGTLSGNRCLKTTSYAATYTPSSCSAGVVNWGTGNLCMANVSAQANGSSISTSNVAPGVSGSTTAICSDGYLYASGGSCQASLSAVVSITATKGDYADRIVINWPSVPGASGYTLEYRLASETVWKSVASSTNQYSYSTNIDDLYEFRVQAKNALGQGPWSSTASGYIRPKIMAEFVSQNVPTDVKAGSIFSATQVWKNVGTNSWTDTTFQLLGAAGSADFGSSVGTFPGTVAYTQTGTSTLSLTAPSVPGIYSFSRQFAKSSVNYGSPSTPVSIRVWGDPQCSALTVSSPYLYDQAGTVGVQFAVNNQTTTQTAKAWNEMDGEASAKAYTPVAGLGVYKFDIPLAGHGGRIGTYRVKVNVSNVVANASCEISFELRPLATPVVDLQALIGTGDGANSFVVGQTTSQAILAASVTRTENLPMSLTLRDDSGETAASASLAAGAASTKLGGARWTGDAWSMRPYTLRVSYADPGAAAQGKYLDVPVTLILAPTGNTLSLSIAAGHPLTATTAVGRGAEPYDHKAQGDWTSKVGAQGGADLDSLGAMNEEGKRQHQLDYNNLVGKSLIGTARAMPPAGISLINPLEITTVAKIPTLPVKNLQATDGTQEDIVRVTWEAPATSGSFNYDVYREGELIQSNKNTRSLDDIPPVRGREYIYRVIANFNVQPSAEATDPGHLPACRAARLIGARLNADMSAINGVIEQWNCLEGLQGTSVIDTQAGQELSLQGAKTYKAFSVTVPAGLADGAHMLRLELQSQGVVLNAERTYDVPFQLNRASIAVNDMTITYDGSPAKAGQEASSIGRFGVRMEGGSGIGFAEEVK